ncbi:peptide ABC transporter ATP-binding protein [Halogeometricum borinquense]|uniref:Peptide ABC transporter ATP-binding protein n=1 Tax=Halogeometricum borinquense TaxID=60847 RepID=A0A6C0UN60_9EURY|nr:peptide ABC transporter ATP-binding protein [Halogeometricum borinquense]QIB76023.1 peptide ABC transporter ATP-binding protein [Halogeometricum borinquense]
MSKTDLVAPLSVATDDLTLTVAGVTMPVRSTGDRLFVEVPTLRSAVRVARAVNTVPSGPTRLLTVTDLTTELRVRGRTVAVFGAHARPGPLARELGIAPAEFRLGGALAAASSGATAAVDHFLTWLR